LEGIKEAARRDREGGASGGGDSGDLRDPDADLKLQHGSKPMALLRLLQKILAGNRDAAAASGAVGFEHLQQHKVIVFSMWHGGAVQVESSGRIARAVQVESS
jgi:hypothetical protein